MDDYKLSSEAIARATQKIQYLDQIDEARSKAGYCPKCRKHLWDESSKEVLKSYICPCCDIGFCESCGYSHYNREKRSSEWFCSKSCKENYDFDMRISKGLGCLLVTIIVFIVALPILISVLKTIGAIILVILIIVAVLGGSQS